jgi:Fe-S-cluster containining protein
MQTKKCMRSGQCCSAHFALVPKHETSDLSDKHLDTLEDAESYIEANSEMMGTPCKWLVRDSETTEATCKAHTRKSDHCVSYPEHIIGSEWCPVGVMYWKDRKSEGLKIPEWVDKVLISLS